MIPACVPPASSESPEGSAPAPRSSEGGIPWAPGEEPGSPEQSAREIPDQEPREAEAISAGKEDGVLVEGSSGACSGKAPPALRAEVDVRATETRACYDRMPAAKQGASGEVRVNLRVKENGSAEVVKVLADSLKVPAVSSCIIERLEKPFQEAPLGGCVGFVIPLQLAPNPEENEQE